MPMFEVTHKTWDDQDNDSRVAWVLAPDDATVGSVVGNYATFQALNMSPDDCCLDLDAVLPRESSALRNWAKNSNPQYPVCHYADK